MMRTVQMFDGTFGKKTGTQFHSRPYFVELLRRPSGQRWRNTLSADRWSRDHRG
jgi:hypothetical protein